MKFLHKIWSGYDGFTPQQIPKRLHRNILPLGWGRYIDSVEEGHEVWVYFHGPGVAPFGVYAKGFVQSTDTAGGRVHLRVREDAADRSLTDSETSERIAGIIKARGLQVFVYPEDWDTPPECNVGLTADSCRARRCRSCETWKRLPLIDKRAHLLPRRFPHDLKGFAPTYWVIPRRCYLHHDGRRIAAPVDRASELFYRFNSGEANLAYPLALGIDDALRKRRLLDTRLDEVLELAKPITKRRLRIQERLTPNQFERLYCETLSVDPRVRSYRRLLLIDEVSTEGSTIRCAARRIRGLNPEAAIVAATAGQMIAKHVVADESALVRN